MITALEGIRKETITASDPQNPFLSLRVSLVEGSRTSLSLALNACFRMWIAIGKLQSCRKQMPTAFLAQKQHRLDERQTAAILFPEAWLTRQRERKDDSEKEPRRLPITRARGSGERERKRRGRSQREARKCETQTDRQQQEKKAIVRQKRDRTEAESREEAILPFVTQTNGRSQCLMPSASAAESAASLLTLRLSLPASDGEDRGNRDSHVRSLHPDSRQARRGEKEIASPDPQRQAAFVLSFTRTSCVLGASNLSCFSPSIVYSCFRGHHHHLAQTSLFHSVSFMLLPAKRSPLDVPSSLMTCCPSNAREALNKSHDWRTEFCLI